MDRKVKKTKIIKSILLGVGGLVIGFANGFFGGGGGMMLVPLLAFGAKLEQKKSHATAIAIILPLSIITALIYTLCGTYSVKTGLVTAGGVIAGGVVGAVLLKKLSNKVLSIIFYIVMIAAGIRMIIR